MGVDVELRRVRQEGTSPRRRKTEGVRWLHDPGGRLDALLDRVQHRGRTPMLDRIDPFSDLELTPADMPQFLEELSVVAAEATSREELDVVRELRALAEQCRDDPGLILLFTGD